MMSQLITPDLADRPHDVRAEHTMRAGASETYQAFTSGWESWFAAPGTLLADPRPNGQLFFVVEFDGRRHPHYGRFLALAPDRRVELTWLTGKGGTQGAETLLSITIEPRDEGCHLVLDHRGFYDRESADQHGQSWEQILAHLDRRLMNA